MSVSSSFSGLIPVTGIPKLPVRFQTPKAFRLRESNKLIFNSRSIYGASFRYSVSESGKFKCSASLGMNGREARFNKSHVEPFWVTFTKEVIWGLRSLVVFLIEQPGQLKHIEWPGFESTLKTAMLTLVLVGMLIVAISSVDSVLCYVLALLLRKSA